MARFSDGRKDAARGAVAGKKKRIYLAQFNRGDQVDQLAEAGSLGWMLGWSVAVRISTPGSPTFLSPPPPPTPPPEPSSIPRRPPLLPPPGLSTSLLLSFSLSLSATTLARQQLSTLPDVLNSSSGTLHRSTLRWPFH